MAVELKQIRIERSVGDALTTSAFDLLPDEIRQDYAVSWLRGFSDQESRQNNYRNEYSSKDRPELYLVMGLIRQIVTDNVKFYSAILFHIGRRLKIAELADQKIDAALRPEHLQETIKANKSLTVQNADVAATNILQETLHEAKRVHRSVSEQNWSLWLIWKKEISEFQRAMEDTSEKLYRGERDRYDNPFLGQAPARLVRDSFRHKELKLRMDALDVRVETGDATVDPQTLAILQLLSMEWHELRDRLELIRQDNINKGLDADALKKQQDEEMSAYIQKQLAGEFGDTDPFTAYAPLGKLPDATLYNLYTKCKLPGFNSRFYYADRWLEALAEPFDYYYEHRVPVFKSELTAADIRNYAHSADSAIKRNWVEKNGNSSGLPEHRIQYSFEKEWIEPLVVAVRYGDKKRNQDWTLAAVTELISAVVNHLNGLGYQLTTPLQARIEKLWNAAKDISYSLEW